jgi:hypothetical protein
MKRILAIVVIVFSLLPINSSTAAVPAQGNSCSKLGVIQVYKGTKYTCTKSGKKLIWTKTPNKPSVSVSPSAMPDSGNKSANTPSPTYVAKKAFPYQGLCAAALIFGG